MATAKTKTSATAETGNASPSTGIDLSKLTPEQLAALQKQLKASKTVSKTDKEARFKLIDSMLQAKVEKGEEKDGEKAGEFKYTTRDIVNALDKDGLITATQKADEKWDQVEIKKIQARKQFLEKKRNEKGELVHPEGTFGYRQSAGAGFALTPVRIVSWFGEVENVKKLDTTQRATVLKALGSK